jgi:hypothetical protein
MEPNHRTDEERAIIARGWRCSGLPQDGYAAQFQVSGRTLRSLLRQWALPPVAPDQAAAKIIEDAVAKLLSVLGSVRAASIPEIVVASPQREPRQPVPMPAP